MAKFDNTNLRLIGGLTAQILSVHQYTSGRPATLVQVPDLTHHPRTPKENGRGSTSLISKMNHG